MNGVRERNIEMLMDTLQCSQRGYYQVGKEKKLLKLSEKQMREAQVFLPEDLERIRTYDDHKRVFGMDRCTVDCVNADSFHVAREIHKQHRRAIDDGKRKPVLVLNLASAVNPGGGVRRGARAQEEDLCRKSTLLMSLESETAGKYYAYNRKMNSLLGSDGIIISPSVEIIKDDDGNYLEESVVVSVMTCAAPNVRKGFEGLSSKEYEQLLYHRIEGMFAAAAHLKYNYLVLGAFGCGAFANDARVVSDVFFKVMKEFRYPLEATVSVGLAGLFEDISFAVLDQTEDQYNFRQFSRNFREFYRMEDLEEIRALELKKKEERETDGVCLDRIRGSLFGGAAGDALGYPIEFMRESEISQRYGVEGPDRYIPDPQNGKAVISDDTQMSLFTACGLLYGVTRMNMRGIGSRLGDYVQYAYQSWYLTQTKTFAEINSMDELERYRSGAMMWLMEVPELYARRAPGMTCMSELQDPHPHQAKNDSKGCGGIMRIAPLALTYRWTHGNMSVSELETEARYIAGWTHGHPLGKMPAAVLTHIIDGILRYDVNTRQELKNVIQEAVDAIAGYPDITYKNGLQRLLRFAVSLAENHDDDMENIHQIGEGWVAEETLAIAIYCSLRYADDFSAGIRAAVNHNGDSDSTGAVTGNILGALLGYKAIPDTWKKDLELSDVILEMADDLFFGCRIDEYNFKKDMVWYQKYVMGHKPQK